MNTAINSTLIYITVTLWRKEEYTITQLNKIPQIQTQKVNVT